MDETQWLTASLTRPLIDAVFPFLSDRRLRLFACGCCRQLWHLLPEMGQKSLLAAEAIAENRYAPEKILRARERAMTVLNRLTFPGRRNDIDPHWLAMRAVTRSLSDNPGNVAFTALDIFQGIVRDFENPLPSGEWSGDEYADRHEWAGVCLANVLRDILRNPFEPALEFSEDWRSPDVLGLARSIEMDADFALLPILHDALMEAGCGDERVLEHCRTEDRKIHVRGCWLIDQILRIE